MKGLTNPFKKGDEVIYQPEGRVVTNWESPNKWANEDKLVPGVEYTVKDAYKGGQVSITLEGKTMHHPWQHFTPVKWGIKGPIDGNRRVIDLYNKVAHTNLIGHLDEHYYSWNGEREIGHARLPSDYVELSHEQFLFFFGSREEAVEEPVAEDLYPKQQNTQTMKKYTIEDLKGAKIAIRVSNREQILKFSEVGIKPLSESSIRSVFRQKIPSINIERATTMMYSSLAGTPQGYYEQEDFVYIDFEQVVFPAEEQKGKIIGYKSPMDLFEGTFYLKAGSLFVPVTAAGTTKGSYYAHGTDATTTAYSRHLPKQIVETWEPVFAPKTAEVIVGENPSYKVIIDKDSLKVSIPGDGVSLDIQLVRDIVKNLQPQALRLGGYRVQFTGVKIGCSTFTLEDGEKILEAYDKLNKTTNDERTTSQSNSRSC